MFGFIIIIDFIFKNKLEMGGTDHSASYSLKTIMKHVMGYISHSVLHIPSVSYCRVIQGRVKANFSGEEDRKPGRGSMIEEPMQLVLI